MTIKFDTGWKVVKETFCYCTEMRSVVFSEDTTLNNIENFIEQEKENSKFYQEFRVTKNDECIEFERAVDSSD